MSSRSVVFPWLRGRECGFDSLNRHSAGTGEIVPDFGPLVQRLERLPVEQDVTSSNLVRVVWCARGSTTPSREVARKREFIRRGEGRDDNNIGVVVQFG